MSRDTSHPRQDAKTEGARTIEAPEAPEAPEERGDDLPLSSPPQPAAPVWRVPPPTPRLHKDAPLARYGH